MLYGARIPEIPSSHDGGVIEGLSASRQLDLLNTLSLLESELKISSSSVKHDNSDESQCSPFKKASLREQLQVSRKSAVDILISIGKGMELSDINCDLSGRSEPLYFGLHALRDRLKSELNMELHPKDLEFLIQEIQERNREDVNYTDLLVLSQLNYDKWKRNRAMKCESKSARKEKEPNLKAPDMAAIMGVIEDASYNFISLNDDRINRYNVQSMDSSTFKEALEDLNIQLSSRERRALEGKYLLDAIGNIDFATFRADFISQGSQLMEERRMVTGATLEHASHQNIIMSGITVTTDKDTISRSLNDAFDASCSLENSMILNILGSPGNTQRASKGSQFMNEMVFTNVALEDIFAAAQSASNTPSKQSFACNTLESRKSSKGYLKPLQFPITSHLEQAPELHTITPAESTTEVSIDYHTKEVCHLGNSTDSDDESELDKHSSRRTSSKDSTGSSQIESRQSSLSSAVAVVEGSEKAISASNDEIIEAISRRVEETALKERKASLLRAQSFQLEKRASLSQLDSLCPKPDYVPGKRRYSRDPTNHMKIIELTGRMEVKSSATKGNRDSGRGSVEAEKEELDEEVDSDSDNTPNKMQFEK